MSSIPEGYRYTEEHEWIFMEDEFTALCGITDHAQEMLTDIVFVELPEIDIDLKKGDQVAVVESVKAVSDVYSPVSGRITAVNAKLESSPDLINSDPYGDGWIFKIEVKNPDEVGKLMDNSAYAEHVAGES